MTEFRRVISIAACSFVMLGLASGIASANTIFSSQTATGTLTNAGAPPNVDSPTSPGPGPNAPSEVVGVNGYSQAAANAAIAASCPIGFICSAATFYQIDLSVAATTSGSLTVTNTGGPTAIPCLTNVGTCDGSAATATNGISLEGNLTLNTYDPLSNDVLVEHNTPTFSIATNSVTGFGAGQTNYLTIGSGNTNESGTGTLATSSPNTYNNTQGALWTTASAAYSCATVNCVTLDLFLSGGSSIGNPQPAGVGSTNNIDSITGGSVIVAYDYSYTETQIGGTPEPATLFLMGSALVGIGLLRKRIKS